MKGFAFFLLNAGSTRFMSESRMWTWPLHLLDLDEFKEGFSW